MEQRAAHGVLRQLRPAQQQVPSLSPSEYKFVETRKRALTSLIATLQWHGTVPCGVPAVQIAHIQASGGV